MILQEVKFFIVLGRRGVGFSQRLCLSTSTALGQFLPLFPSVPALNVILFLSGVSRQCRHLIG